MISQDPEVARHYSSASVGSHIQNAKELAGINVFPGLHEYVIRHVAEVQRFAIWSFKDLGGVVQFEQILAELLVADRLKWTSGVAGWLEGESENPAKFGADLFVLDQFGAWVPGHREHPFVYGPSRDVVKVVKLFLPLDESHGLL